jgi:hypothetical protein
LEERVEKVRFWVFLLRLISLIAQTVSHPDRRLRVKGPEMTPMTRLDARVGWMG